MKKIQTDITPQKINLIKSELRPTHFSEYIGQEFICRNLQVAIQAAKLTGQCLGHLLFYGPPGLGKTTLANIIAGEIGSSLHVISGPSIERTGELAAILATLEENDVLFIDEIHRMPKFVEESLYSAMEDYKLDIIIGDNQQSKTVTLELPRFTLIGATTKLGLLSAPLRDRFAMIFCMEYYTDAELCQIIQRTAKLYHFQLSDSVALEIAKVSRQTPRIANNLTKRVTDYLLVHKKKPTVENVQTALSDNGYLNFGFTQEDYKYLSILKASKGKPVGLKTLASILGETVDTIQESLEPYLLRQEFVSISGKGRILTEKGENYYGAICT